MAVILFNWGEINCLEHVYLATSLCRHGRIFIRCSIKFAVLIVLMCIQNLKAKILYHKTSNYISETLRTQICPITADISRADFLTS